MFSKSATNVYSDKSKSYERFKTDAILYKVCCHINVNKDGKYGTVYAVRDKYAKIYAAKVMNFSSENESNKKDFLSNELQNLIECQNPTVVKLHGYSEKDFENYNKYVLFMEYAKNGTLSDYIKEIDSSINYNDNTIRQIILVGIVYGMMYIHKKGIIHFDLKPDNILLDENFYPLISDFGISERNEPGKKIKFLRGTPIYMAPEAINAEEDNIDYYEKADVYSFGILMFEFLTKSHPYPDYTHKTTVAFQKSVILDKIRPTFVTEVKESLKELIEKCWSENPNDRPTFDELFDKLSGNEDEGKYFLDNVDVDELNFYINKITGKIQKGEKNSSDFGPGKSCYDLRRKVKNVESDGFNDDDDDKNYDNLKKQFDLIKVENDHLNDFISTIQTEKNQLKTQLEELNKNYIDLKKEKSDDLKRFKQETDSLNDRILDYEEKLNEIDELEEQIRDLNNRNIELDNENKNIHELNDASENRINFLEEENQRLSNQIHILESQITTLQQEKNNQIERNRELTRMNVNKVNQINELNEQNRNLIAMDEIKTNRINELNEQNQNLNRLNENNNNRINKLERANSNLINQKIVSLVVENRQLMQQQNQLKSEIEKINNENQLLLKKTKTKIIMKDKNEKKQKNSENKVDLYKNVFGIGFNSLNVKMQQLFISEILNKSDYSNLNPSLINVNNLLLYFLKFREAQTASNYLNILTEDENELSLEIIAKNKDLNRIRILYEATETLYNNNSLNSPDFLDLLSKFDGVIIEIKYPSNLYLNIYNLVISEIKNSNISIFISDQNETDLNFRDNKIINYIKLDSSILSIKGLDNGCGGSFYACSSLKKVVIPSSVHSIGSYAFAECSSLIEVKIPSSVTVIKSHAFEGCSSLINVKILNYVVSIGEFAFYKCVSLVSISISTKMNSIETKTFCDCESLQEIIIPATITSIGKGAFANCSSLHKIKFFSPNLLNKDKKLKIEKNAFKKCVNLKKLLLPSHLEYLDIGAFKKCSSLEEMKILSKFVTFGRNAFLDCPLNSVAIYSEIEKKFKRKELGIRKDPAMFVT